MHTFWLNITPYLEKSIRKNACMIVPGFLLQHAIRRILAQTALKSVTVQAMIRVIL